jgi:hypothetical protein
LAPALEPNQLILEGVMTTQSKDGQVNIAPMGPIVDREMTKLILRPFTSSTTYRNLKATREGVFHITDDVLLLARGAIGKVAAGDTESGAAIRPADKVAAVVLTGACRYYEFRVTSLDDSQQRTRIEAQVVHANTLRPFIGFNRAKHAVLEAAILATRLHLTGSGPILLEYERLATLVDKTGSQREHQAMAELRSFVEAYVQTDTQPNLEPDAGLKD